MIVISHLAAFGVGYVIAWWRTEDPLLRKGRLS